MSAPRSVAASRLKAAVRQRREPHFSGAVWRCLVFARGYACLLLSWALVPFPSSRARSSTQCCGADPGSPAKLHEIPALTDANQMLRIWAPVTAGMTTVSIITQPQRRWITLHQTSKNRPNSCFLRCFSRLACGVYKPESGPVRLIAGSLSKAQSWTPSSATCGLLLSLGPSTLRTFASPFWTQRTSLAPVSAGST